MPRAPTLNKAAAVLLLTMTVTSIAVAAQPNKVSNFIDSKGSDTPAGSSVRDALRPGDEGLKAPSFTSDVGPDGKLVYPLDLKLSYKREGHRALGTITITNTLKQPVEIPDIGYDIRFMQPGGVHKDDIRQQGPLKQCGSIQLPTTLAPGAKLVCPLDSRENIYKGKISVVAFVDECDKVGAKTSTNQPARKDCSGPGSPGKHVAFDVVVNL